MRTPVTLDMLTTELVRLLGRLTKVAYIDVDGSAVMELRGDDRTAEETCVGALLDAICTKSGARRTVMSPAGTTPR